MSRRPKVKVVLDALVGCVSHFEIEDGKAACGADYRGPITANDRLMAGTLPYDAFEDTVPFSINDIPEASYCRECVIQLERHRGQPGWDGADWWIQGYYDDLNKAESRGR